MKNISLLIAFFALIFSGVLQAQDFVSYDGDTVCLLDSDGRKQGEWLFFNDNNSIVMACEFKNDSLINNRVFYRGRSPWMVRYQAIDNREAFTVITTGERRINGYFNSANGDINLENPADSAFCPFDSLVYFVGIPGQYLFASVSAEKYFNLLCNQLQQSFFDNDATIIYAIKANGLVENVQVQLKNKNKKLEKELLKNAQLLRRWQPAFKHNKTEPFTYKLHQHFEAKETKK